MISKGAKKVKLEKESESADVKILPTDVETIESVGTQAVEEKSVIVSINRVTKVVKGGKRFSFNALVVVGNGQGKVGVALGKSNEVQSAIQKAIMAARKDMMSFPLFETTIPHEVIGKFGSGLVWMKPAVSGTGLIAGGGVRAILEAGGVRNVLTKNLGSRNPFNTVYATMDALKKLKNRKAVNSTSG